MSPKALRSSKVNAVPLFHRGLARIALPLWATRYNGGVVDMDSSLAGALILVDGGL